MSKVSFETTYDGHCKTYVAVHATAHHLLNTAEETELGSLLNLQAAMVFMAFAFESYLNHVGSEEIPFWDQIERISWGGKLEAISKQISFKLDKSRAPFQDIIEIFKFRDYLAHGRTQKLDPKPKVTAEQPPYDHAWRLLPHEILKAGYCRKLFESLGKAIEQINAARPNPESKTWLWNQGMRSASTKPVF